MLETLTYVPESHAALTVGKARRTRAIVADAEHELSVIPHCRNLDSRDAGDLFHAVFHRILHQWLKNEARHERLARVVAHLHIDLELVLESYLHDLGVSLEKRGLVDHWHFRF